MSLFKKRPKGFKGTPAWKMPSDEPAASPDAHEERSNASTSTIPAETPVSVPLSASCKKLAISGPSSSAPELEDGSDDDYEYIEELEGYRLFHCQDFKKSLETSGVCPCCKSSLTLSENLVGRRGLVSKVRIVCSKDDCGYGGITVCDPCAPSAKSLNTRSVLAMRVIGRGHTYQKQFCGVMDMLPPVSKHSFSFHNSKVAEATLEAAKDEMLAACKYLHELHGAEPEDVIDVTVTCDGTWSKRGFTATYGVVVVISWKTGQVLDYEILSKRCNACERQKTKWGEDSDRFKEWMETHKENCAINHIGSSPAMECEGVLRIWRRSIETRRLKYTNVISDGDSKSLASVNQEKPYGTDVVVEKQECVGHVQKRVTPYLKKARTSFKQDKSAATAKVKQLKEKMKHVKEEYGLGSGRGRGRGRGASGTGRYKGKGRGKRVFEEGEGEKKLAALQEALDKIHVPQGKLLDDTISQLQKYYGNAIRGSVGDLERMTDACWAVLYHSLSSDDNPRHYCCPKGRDSWCKYQRALARGEDPPSHHVPTRSCSANCTSCHTTIPADFVEYAEPQWRSLCDPTLLKKCVLGATQNANESFNNLIWEKAPKTEYVSLNTISSAVGQAVIVFNSGKQALVKLMDKLDIPAGPLCTSHLAAEDKDRLDRAQRKIDIVAKKRRQTIKRRDALTEQQHLSAEGPTYEAGGF